MKNWEKIFLPHTAEKKCATFKKDEDVLMK